MYPRPDAAFDRDGEEQALDAKAHGSGRRLAPVAALALARKVARTLMPGEELCIISGGSLYESGRFLCIVIGSDKFLWRTSF